MSQSQPLLPMHGTQNSYAKTTPTELTEVNEWSGGLNGSPTGYLFPFHIYNSDNSHNQLKCIERTALVTFVLGVFGFVCYMLASESNHKSDSPTIESGISENHTDSHNITNITDTGFNSTQLLGEVSADDHQHDVE